ncbi:MAG: right-handed parallel beta-helix repeat-containing protein, partial [Clostridia bacterium]|nr:right-handed parallel beta-helix repeat-containing protein [Clostridia bacterium]
FMIFILPFLRFADYFRAPAETFTYTKSEAAGKPGREEVNYPAGSGDIYVSQEGDDAGSGSEASPVKSLQRAIELTRDRAENEITVRIAGGVYELGGPLIIENSEKAIRFCAVSGEEVRISGSQKIDGWQEDEVNGMRCLCAPAPASKAFTTLLRGDTPLPVARYPECGYFYVRATDHSGGLFTDETTPWKNWSYGDLRITPDRNQKILSFHSPGGVTLRLLHFWCGEISQVAGYDEKSGRIALATPLSMRVEEGQKYYFENVREALDKPGEWYYDPESSRIYYIPLEGETAENIDLRFAVTDKLVTIGSSGNITFEGITFCDTCSPFPELEGHNHWLAQYGMRHPQAEFDCGGAVEATASRNINFHNCVFRNIGTCAVKFIRADKDCSVDCCDLNDIGASGIYIDGAERGGDDEITERITVRDTVIKSYGRYFYSGCGILLTHARGCSLVNNEISDGYYTAISAGWVWGYPPSVTNNIRIENNLIYNIGQGWLSDMDGVY